MSYWQWGLFECQHMREDVTQPHLSARMACGTGREGRRQRVEPGDPETPGLRSDSWQKHQEQRGWRGEGQCQRALTDLWEGRADTWTCINWTIMQLLMASQMYMKIKITFPSLVKCNVNMFCKSTCISLALYMGSLEMNPKCFLVLGGLRGLFYWH